MENSLIDKIKEAIINFSLIEKNEKVLIGVSGGPDSLALLAALNKLKNELNFSIAVATFNHLIRDESGSEVEFVRELTKNLGVPFYTKQEDILKIAKMEFLSLEEAARKARLDFLFAIKDENHFDKIALAHTLDDLVETMLFHLIKGTGASGLIGMKPKSFNGIIHPMLSVEKKEVLVFLTNAKISYKSDLTNLSLRYERNKVRLQIVPMFEAMNPNFNKHMLYTSLVLRDEDEFIEAISNKDAKVIKDGDSYSISIFNNLPIFEKRRILRAILGKESNFERIERAMLFLKGKFGRLNIFGETYIVSSSSHFWLEQKTPFTIDRKIVLEIPGTTVIPDADLAIETLLSSNLPVLDNLNVAFDLKELKLPLRARFRREGDKMLTEVGYKKVQDIFTDCKVRRDKRYKTPIVTDRDDEILWIPGVKRSSLNKISNKASQTLILKAVFNKK